MKYTKYVKPEDINSLEFEVISQDLKIFITRELSDRIFSPEFPEHDIIYQNKIINLARTIANMPIYVLEGDGDGFFHPAEHAWHNGEFQLAIRRLNTLQLAEFLGELIEEEIFNVREINNLLDADGASFSFILEGNDLVVEVLSIATLEENENDDAHPNIRVLVSRMENALAQEDYSNVLHASASIFETMAKDVVGIKSIQNQSLKGFFERYRNDSLLSEEILDYIIGIYELRNTTPLAGHGSTQPPDVTREIAITLSEMTKAFIRIEYALHREPTSTNA